ncbi:MAG TPA: hypothetical protein ENJ53_00145 [Phaeodactylibacter sp.]|nr:hypothetical protein [Phaeodactylibacter sp.]
MFDHLPHTFRKHQLSADVRTLLQLRRAMEKGLVRTLGDVYYVLKGLITSAPTEIGPFSKAFYEHFLGMDIRQGESLEDAVNRSDAFKGWKANLSDEELEDVSKLDLVDKFLDEVHLTSFDIERVLSGKDILAKDNPEMEDEHPSTEGSESIRRHLDRMADYRDIPLEELLRRMRAVAQQQKGKHSGGDHWIGTGGISPYGHGGAAAGGLRVGGTGGGKMARAAINSREFYPVDTKALLKDDNIDAALAALKGIDEGTAEIILDIPKTITEGLKQGGIFLPHEKEKVQQKKQVILMIDNGGWSMSPYVKSVQKLFSKMKTRFAHDLKIYYFHNSVYGGLYADVARWKFEPVDKIIRQDKNYSVFVIGDADMASYELSRASIHTWQTLSDHFQRMVWLNPMRKSIWHTSMTCSVLMQMFPMFGLTPEGIEEAVLEMNRRRKFG